MTADMHLKLAREHLDAALTGPDRITPIILARGHITRAEELLREQEHAAESLAAPTQRVGVGTQQEVQRGP